MEEQFTKCEKGHLNGSNALCGDCAREANEYHYGFVDVFGNWTCFSGCPKCYQERD